MATTFDFGDGKGPVPAKRHRNPDRTLGGWVAHTAEVASTAFIGPNAKVFDQAKVFGKVRVFDNAKVYGRAEVCGDACVCGDAWVFGDALVSGVARVYGYARVCGDAKVLGNVCAWVGGFELSDVSVPGTEPRQESMAEETAVESDEPGSILTPTPKP